MICETRWVKIQSLEDYEMKPESEAMLLTKSS